MPAPIPPYTGPDGAYRLDVFPATYRVYVYVETAGTYQRGEKTGIKVSKRQTVEVDVMIDPSPRSG